MPENNDDAADGPAPRTVVDERSLSPMHRTIANGLQESDRNAVHVTASREVDAEALIAAADAMGDDVSIMDVLLHALSETLDAHLSSNATFEEGKHRSYEEHNVTVAVDVDAGLVTPVIADADSKSFSEIATERVPEYAGEHGSLTSTLSPCP